ncbi:MAG: ABC transporter ATP-binding protein [Rhodospirillaceae bacterium]|jgi:general nucleoside transport system ATP-binding protein|nr:ABC transporter ATP-binding protein [Rhodospirillaceae bacterium]MBT5244674.1 ABC transporter ATP-binding protein [Rhodospirillaceae bacterium]MBT5562415.1 ABC transporter ATP-binding protein [Rhodospirillaceae bacterium]MBT6242053.1 ABC transporter ATP-binding protein [Rhodospirillaceae bacterium]MBT7136891.1 ABC transporter ATP-binding protein [Rhodospirillaceae bacterium]
MSSEILLELEGITKAFPGVIANDDVSFKIGHGEIHALLGENGAGKSTLVKMIYGVLKSDSGVMHMHGEHYNPSKPAEARAHGVGMVFQHFSLFEALSVADNIALGISPELAKGDLPERIIEISKYYGLELDPKRTIGDLSVGIRQRVEIVRCLLQNPKLIIMDEPTSVLTPGEVQTLFKVLRRLTDEGCSILYISHKLEEIRDLCHHATILRGGKVIGTCTPSEESAKSLAEMMIGETLTPPKRLDKDYGPVRLKVSNLTTESVGVGDHSITLKDISFSVRSGEIVGVAGVAGNGQRRLMSALIGDKKCNRAEAVIIDETPCGLLDPDERRAIGLCCVPEERLGHAAVPDMTLVENTILSARVRMNLCERGFLNIPAARKMAEDVVETFKVKTAGTEHVARSLSGGNLQKFIMGREIMQTPDVFIASQPTWGVDAGAASEIHEAIIQLAKNGTAVLMISQDLDELFAIADSIAVIADGRLSKPTVVEDLTTEQIGREMGGQSEVASEGADADL